MKRNDINKFPKNSPEFVILHSLLKQKKRLKPSLRFKKEYNPKKALHNALQELREKHSYFIELDITGVSLKIP